MAKQAVSRKPAKKHTVSDANSNNKRKRPKSNIQNGGNNSKGSASKVLVIVFIAVGVACIGAYYHALRPVFVWNLASKTMQKEQVGKKMKPDERVVPKEVQDFKPTIQSTLQMKSIQVDGKELKIQELKHAISKSTVKAYIVDGFLSDYECDGLAGVHGRHVHELVTKNGPIICFAGIETLWKYLKEVGLKMKLTTRDFTDGTTCVNETLSSKLKMYLKWSFSTAFYPGENKFSTTYAEKIEKVTGLKRENGGKFQITSYPWNVDGMTVDAGYKNHTDCVVAEDGQGDKRDRYATVLVYLRDVEEGGETSFPQLGISVKPKKGRALIWNSMTIDGNCDPTSLHNAAKVVRGHKIILQRWYYYKNFPALGMRAPEPHLPVRKPAQPRVTCDEYEQGSCRWYDEWNYEHIVEYAANTDNII